MSEIENAWRFKHYRSDTPRPPEHSLLQNMHISSDSACLLVPCGRRPRRWGPWTARRSSWSCTARTGASSPMHGTGPGSPQYALAPHATLYREVANETLSSHIIYFPTLITLIQHPFYHLVYKFFFQKHTFLIKHYETCFLSYFWRELWQLKI